MLGFIHHRIDQVAAGDQVVQGLGRIGADALRVIVVGHALGDTPQLPTPVVMIDQRGLPSVFIEIHVALGIDVPHPWLDGALNFPYTVQLVASQVLIDMAGFENVGVLERRRRQAVVVVGDVHLLLADQLPVVTVGRAIEQVAIVRGTHTVRRGSRTVISDLRGAADPALPRVVDPGQAWFLHLVDGLVHQHHAAGQASWRRYLLLVIEQDVAGVGLGIGRHELREGNFI
ncbi:hypothetical protein D3C86_957680 [compost metagenome]